jgi:peptide/nickel transport system permease protein
LARAFSKTLSLTFGAVALWLLIGIPLGVVSALRPGSAWDRVALVFALLGISAPVYWIGLVLLKVFADGLDWLPLGGYVALTERGPLAWAHALALPWFALAMLYAGWYARMTRSQMLDVADHAVHNAHEPVLE